MSDLRKQVIRLAYEKPELQEHLLPLLKIAANPHPLLVKIVDEISRDWPNVSAHHGFSRDNYYGADQTYHKANRYTVDLFGDGISVQIFLQLDAATKEIVTGPDAWLARPLTLLIGSKGRETKIQDVHHVLKVVKDTVASLLTKQKQKSNEEVGARMATLALEIAKGFTHAGRPEIKRAPHEITVSFWGEAGDTAAGQIEGEHDDVEYVADMRERKKVHDRFLDTLLREVRDAHLQGHVSKIDTEGVPDDGEFYTFHILLK